jgi:hypothetical protein
VRKGLRGKSGRGGGKQEGRRGGDLEKEVVRKGLRGKEWEGRRKTRGEKRRAK